MTSAAPILVGLIMLLGFLFKSTLYQHFYSSKKKSSGTSPGVYLSLLLACFFINSCAGNLSKKPLVLVDIEEYSNDGIKAYNNAQWSKAQLFFSKALQLSQGIDDQEGVLLSILNLAEVSLALHDHTKSKQYLVQAGEITKYAAYQHYNPRINLLYGLNALAQKQLSKAEAILQKLLPIFENDKLNTIPDDIQLAAIASLTRIAFLKKQDALLWTNRYANALQKTANKSTNRTARLLRFQADLLLQYDVTTKEKDNEAESKMQQALLLYKENLSRAGTAATLFELAQFYRKKHRWQEMQDYFNRSKAVYSFLKNTEKLELITEILAQQK